MTLNPLKMLFNLGCLFLVLLVLGGPLIAIVGVFIVVMLGLNEISNWDQ